VAPNQKQSPLRVKVGIKLGAVQRALFPGPDGKVESDEKTLPKRDLEADEFDEDVRLASPMKKTRQQVLFLKPDWPEEIPFSSAEDLFCASKAQLQELNRMCGCDDSVDEEHLRLQLRPFLPRWQRWAGIDPNWENHKISGVNEYGDYPYKKHRYRIPKGYTWVKGDSFPLLMTAENNKIPAARVCTDFKKTKNDKWQPQFEGVLCRPGDAPRLRGLQ
jgi:hypothetical protein